MRRETPIKKDENSYYRLNWMRHAFSCANMLELMDMAGLKELKGLKKDSALSNYGLEQIEFFRQNFKSSMFVLFGFPHEGIFKERQEGLVKERVVLTSNLKRSIETALYTFAGIERIKIIPVPYIGEQSKLTSVIKIFEFDESNIPSKLSDLKDNINKQINEIKKKYPTIDNNIVNWSFLEKAYDIQNKDPLTEVSNDKFNKLVLPDILNFYPNVSDFVVISHTNFIISRSKLSKMKKNTEIITETRIRGNNEYSEWSIPPAIDIYNNSIKPVNKDIVKDSNYARCEFAKKIVQGNLIKVGGLLLLYNQ